MVRGGTTAVEADDAATSPCVDDRAVNECRRCWLDARAVKQGLGNDVSENGITCTTRT